MSTVIYLREFIAIRQGEQGYNFHVEVGFTISNEKSDAFAIAGLKLRAVLTEFDHHLVEGSPVEMAGRIARKLEVNGLDVFDIRLYRGDGTKFFYSTQSVGG